MGSDHTSHDVHSTRPRPIEASSSFPIRYAEVTDPRTSGVFLLMASGLAGVLWSAFGPGATPAAGAVFTAIAGAGLIVGARSRA